MCESFIKILSYLNLCVYHFRYSMPKSLPYLRLHSKVPIKSKISIGHTGLIN